MKYNNIVLITLFAFISVIKCSRILIVITMASPSHYILGNALGRGLAEAGHDVTMMSPFEEKNPPKNGKYRDIKLTGFVEDREKQSKDMNMFDLDNMNPLVMIFMMNFFGDDTREVFEHPNFQQLIKSNEHFDAIIIEQFANDALKVLAHHYKAPLIVLSTLGANMWVNRLVANPAPVSYIPDLFLSYSSNMTFFQRVFNWIFVELSELNHDFYYLPRQNKLMKEFFPDAPDLSILNYNTSLVLLSSHESINQPVPHVPSMVEIGGYHVNPPKELPKDLKDFLDGAKEGVVYFSMGSNLKPSMMPKEKKDAILKALGKIKQKVLWKWDEDDLPGKPNNVKLGKWFPQQDVLAHPNIKLFITHGGLLSTTETVYHGVPILVIPVFADQKINAARAEMNGLGLSLAYSEITEENLSEALDKLLNNPKYRETAKERSTLLHDRPIKPLDLAVYWIEFVIRHKGAPHLRVAGLDLPLYQYLLLDVVSFVALVSISFIVILYIIIKRICCARRKNPEKVKKN